jgi:enoyl-[acyl-carrier protein] reductase I
MLLQGKKGLVLNITNEKSIGWAVAEYANRQGATVGVGAQAERTLKNVNELIQGKERYDAFTIDFAIEEQFEQLRAEVEKKYGKIDFLVHSAAFAPKDGLQGKFMDVSLESFQTSLAVSCFSLVQLCKALEPVMNDNASVMTMSYLGSVRACRNYNVMGVAKAALESAVRYLAVDLGPRGIRVNTISPGPMNTVAARGVKGLLDMINYVADTAPLKRAAVQEDVGGAAVFLMSDLSKGVTGQVIYVDAGYNIVAL